MNGYERERKINGKNYSKKEPLGRYNTGIDCKIKLFKLNKKSINHSNKLGIFKIILIILTFHLFNNDI